MKYTIKLLLVLCLLILSFTFPCMSFADTPSEPLTVNAVESAEENIADESGAGDDDSDLISEADVLTQDTALPEIAEIPDNPDTGVTLAIIPAVIALVLIIAMLVIKKVKK